MADERKLLVVDDEEVVCQACRRIFSRQGFQVETDTDARQGLVKATENDYAIILLDIKMPNMDGIQFLETAPPEEAGRSGADHHRLSQHPQRGRGDAPRRLRLRDQTVHFRGGHLGHATRAEHAARAQRRGRDRRPGKRSGRRRDGEHRDALLGRVLGAACR